MTDPSQVTYYQQANNSFFADMLQHDDFLERYEHLLKGEVLCTVKTTDGTKPGLKEVWIKKYPAKMNPYGVNEVIASLRVVCESRIMALTDFNESEILRLTYENNQRILRLLVGNRDIFEIDNTNTLNSIYMDCKNLVEAQLRRSYEGETLHRITQNTNINENREVSTFKEENTGILPKVPFLPKVR